MLTSSYEKRLESFCSKETSQESWISLVVVEGKLDFLVVILDDVLTTGSLLTTKGVTSHNRHRR
ncbi:MAG: hypothetical protein WAM14_19015 [Candidatus Nitrosopolaris sp.]